MYIIFINLSFIVISVKFIKLGELIFKKMIIDDLNIFILRSFLEKEITTTWEIAKEYDWGEKKDRTKVQGAHFYTAKNNVIEYRIKKMSYEGLINIENNGEKVFVLNTDKVKLSRHKFPGCGLKDCLLIKNSDNFWLIIQTKK